MSTPVILSFTSTKGGVGKTTLTANIAALLADIGLRVLIIDGDVQPSLSKYYILADIDNIIGFVAPSNLSIQEKNALAGIAYLRNIDVYDSPTSKEKAFIELKKNSHILDEFKKFFPFIDLANRSKP